MVIALGGDGQLGEDEVGLAVGATTDEAGRHRGRGVVAHEAFGAAEEEEREQGEHGASAQGMRVACTAMTPPS